MTVLDHDLALRQLRGPLLEHADLTSELYALVTVVAMKAVLGRTPPARGRPSARVPAAPR